MIIEISSSGGFGGIAAAALHKRVDVDQQPPAFRHELCEYFEPRDLDRLAAHAPARKGADIIVYRIIVRDRQSREHVYLIREDQLPPQMLDLIDQM